MNKKWIKTDDDSVQYRREAQELETGQDRVFELYQVQAVEDITGECIWPSFEEWEDITEISERDPEIYAVAHDFVYLAEVDKKFVLDCYGYDSMEELTKQYGPDEADAILAECQFELDSGCLENLMSRIPRMTWNQAKEIIEKIIGMDVDISQKQAKNAEQEIQRCHDTKLERAFQMLYDAASAVNMLANDVDHEKYAAVLDRCAEITECFRNLSIAEDGIISL